MHPRVRVGSRLIVCRLSLSMIPVTRTLVLDKPLYEALQMETWLMTGEMRGARRQSSRAVRGQTSQFHTQTLSGWGADVSVDAWRRAPAAHSITLHQRQRLCVRHGAAERAAPRARRDLACFFLLASCVARYRSVYYLAGGRAAAERSGGARAGAANGHAAPAGGVRASIARSHS